MAAGNNMDPLEWLRKHLEDDDSDLLREMIKSFADQLMAAEGMRCAAPVMGSGRRLG